jgi:hypothetical protein
VPDTQERGILRGFFGAGGRRRRCMSSQIIVTVPSRRPSAAGEAREPLRVVAI